MKNTSLHKSEHSSAGFTLIELLVVVAVIVILMAVLFPALSLAKRQVRTTHCLSNMRGMEMAQQIYAAENDNLLIQAGLGHGGAHTHEEAAWFTTLADYYASEHDDRRLIARCIEDRSPYWSPANGGTGEPVPSSNPPMYRRTSYGINDYLIASVTPINPPYLKLSQVPAPQSIIQFLEMTETGPFAGADHSHIENWGLSNPAAQAAKQLQTNRHGGPEKSQNARANYGFLDGHAETLTFSEVFKNYTDNSFDPRLRE